MRAFLAVAVFCLPLLAMSSRPAAERMPEAGARPLAQDTIPVVLTRDALRFSVDRLVIPVAGIAPGDLENSFRSPRSGGRVHNSIDIMAPHGTPVLAVSDGEVTRRTRNRLGGITLYLTSPDGDYDFYYAHLSRYASGATVGSLVQQGDTLGFVGTTGNARAPHLHFQILHKAGRGRGTPVNPYTVLKGSTLIPRSSTVRG